LEGAPGWRVVERPKRRPWRAGYVIAPFAVCASLFLALVVFQHYWSGSPGADVTPSTAERAGQGPDAGPSAGPLLLPRTTPADLTEGAGSADEATPSIELPPSVAAPIRVFIHHTAGAGNAVPAIQLAAFLQVRGFDVAAIRSVEFQIDRPGVRYFFDRDQPGAQRLVSAIKEFFAKDSDQAPERATGLTDFALKPAEGNVEVWLHGPDTG
jgi:hypothetical protein